MLTIYRVENENFIGPYNSMSSKDLKKVGLSCGSTKQHPSPREDIPGLGWEPFPIDFVCGLDSFEKLINWFSDEQIDALEKFGYTLKEFRVHESDVMIGKCQCLFNRYTAITV